MRQRLVFGLPPIESVPRRGHSAYRRLEAEVRKCGWVVTHDSNNPADSRLRIEDVGWKGHSRGERRRSELSGGFEILPGGDGEVVLHHWEGLEAGLEEIRRQFVAIHDAGVQTDWIRLSARPRVQARGIRIGVREWSHSQFVSELPSFASFGFNSLLLEAFESPQSLSALTDETRQAEWERPLYRLLARLVNSSWWKMVVLPIQLDLSPEKTEGEAFRCSQLCRQHPRARRRLLHRFESIVRRLPETEGIGVSVVDWSRCRCKTCREISFEEETAYYLRAYSAVIKRFAPGAEFWVLPDAGSFERLREIGSQLPGEVRFLVGSRKDDDAGAGGRRRWRPNVLGDPIAEEGELIDLSPFHESDTLSSDRFEDRRIRWEEMVAPDLVVADTHSCDSPPLDLAILPSLFFELRAPEMNKEEWIFQHVLPPEEWRNWKEWKRLNDDLHGWSKRGEGNRQAMGEILDGLKGLGARFNGSRSRVRPSFSPLHLNLIPALASSHRRGAATLRYSAIAERVSAFHDGQFLNGKFLREVQILFEETQDLLESKEFHSLNLSEKRGLEHLRDHLSLTLSEGSRQRFWLASEIPDLRPRSIQKPSC